MEQEDKRIWEERKQTLSLALKLLRSTDRELISALFFEGLSAREYARKVGISDTAVRKRRDRILRNLKKFFSE